MRTFAGTGVITRLINRTVTKNDGTDVLIATMNVDVKDRVKVDKQWDNFHTCLRLQLTAFGTGAQFWLDRFKVGDPIELGGNLREEKYTKKDGTEGRTLILEGEGGNAPYVKWFPKGFTPKEDEQPSPPQDDSQEEPPF